MINRIKAAWPWLGNIVEAVYTVAYGMWVTFRTWIKTYRPERKTFTEHFEYPELPVPVAARYRGFHRFDLTTCIACDQCAKACPVDCIYIGKERVENGKGFKITGYTIDYIDVADPRVVELSGKSVHPIIRHTGSPLDKVVGKVLKLTDEELDAGDDYELSMYRRASVTLASGRSAWVYISTPEGDLRDAAD